MSSYVKQFAYGVVACVVTIVMGLILASVIPVEIRDGGESRNPSSPQGGTRSHTLEEIQEANKDIDERLQRDAMEFRKKSQLERYGVARQGGEWFTFLPWIILPIVARQKEYKHGIATLTPLVIAALFQLILPLEFMLSAIGLVTGILLTNYVSYRRRIAQVKK